MAVLGEPDELWGERVVAVIVKKDETITEADLETYCKESDELADYKRPRHYLFVDELPRNASGKLQKFVLRESLKGAKNKNEGYPISMGYPSFSILNRRNNIFVNSHFFLLKVN